jgi:uncharacterized cupin superfamily protein
MSENSRVDRTRTSGDRAGQSADAPDVPAPVAIVAADAPLRTKPSNYPPEIAARMVGRDKRPLGDVFGLRHFGVNHVRLAPGAVSALRHAHTVQDEFVYVIAGHPTLRTDAGDTPLAPGMCAGFRGGSGDAHCVVNLTDAPVEYLEVGDRMPGDAATYPDDDIAAARVDDRWVFVRKDGAPW